MSCNEPPINDFVLVMAPWLPGLLKKYFRYNLFDMVPGRFFTNAVKQALDDRMENKTVRYQNNLMFRPRSDQIKANLFSQE